MILYNFAPQWAFWNKLGLGWSCDGKTILQRNLNESGAPFKAQYTVFWVSLPYSERC
jgi:hypothetical protein